MPSQPGSLTWDSLCCFFLGLQRYRLLRALSLSTTKNKRLSQEGAQREERLSEGERPKKLDSVEKRQPWISKLLSRHYSLLMHHSLGPWRPAIIFIVFFLVYRDQGFLKPYLDQQKKQKTIKGGANGCVQGIVRIQSTKSGASK